MASIAIEETPTASIEIEDTPETPNEIQGLGATNALTTIANGGDAGDAYNNAVQTGDLTTAMVEWQKKTASQRSASIEGRINPENTEEIIGEVQNLQANMSGVNGNEGYAVEHSKLITQEEEMVSDQALNTMVRNSMTRYNDEESTWEATKSFLGVFIPERKSVLLKEVLDDFGWDNSWADTVVMDTDEIRRFRNVYDDASNINKARIIQAFNESADLHSSNPHIKAELAGQLFAPVFQGENWNNTFNVLDATIVADIAFLAKVGTQALVKGSNILVNINKLKRADLSASAVKGAVENPEAAAKVGVKPANVIDAQDVTMPDSARALLMGTKHTMAPEIRHMFDLQEEIINEVIRTTVRDGVIDVDEQARVISKVKARMSEKENVSRVFIKQIDESSYELRYTTVKFDGRGKEIGKERIVEKKYFTTDDVEGILKADEEFVEKFLALDGNARTRGQLRNYFVSAVERVAPTQSRLTDAVKRAVDEAYRGLNARNEAKVNEALLMGAKYKNSKGDIVGRVYSFDELTEVGIGVNRLKLSPKEAKAYLGYRNVTDQLLELENLRFTENLGARGISIIDLPNQSIPAKVFDTPEGAKGAFIQAGDMAEISDAGVRGSPHISVQGQGLRYWSGKGGMIKLKSFFDVRADDWAEMFEDAYAKGYRLAKNDNAQTLFKHGDTRTQWAFVKEANVVSPRGQKLLNRKRGYIPKQRTNSHFFIKTTKSGVLSGSKGFKVDSTAAWSDNKADAMEWRAKQDNPEDYVILRDGEMSPSQLMYESNSTQGGMYSGARKRSEIEFIGKDGSGEFANSMEAIQGYVNHIGRQYPINLIRLGLEKRAIETASALGIKNVRHLGDLIAKGHTKGVNSKTRKVLKEMHDQVAFLRNIPTEAEIEMSERIHKMGLALEGSLIGKIPGLKKIPKIFYNAAGRGTQPQDYIRGITFNTLLGMYNPAQVLVQASGMFASFAINPAHFAKALPKGIGYSFLDQIQNPFQLKQAYKWMRENGMDEFADGHELWARTGLRENVINSNADYVSVFMRETPYDANVLHKVLSNHTLFYKMGELANTRMAFASALEWYKSVNKLKHVSPDDATAMRAIFKRSEINRLNMSRANQSDLNKGVKAVPFQFQQVISKYYEKILPQAIGGTDELTPIEKMRLFGIVSGLTGAAGVPLAETVYLQMLEMTGTNPEEISPETAIAFKYGALGRMLDLGNINIDLSTRMSLGIDAWKMVAENIREGHDLFEFVGGPTHGVTKRAIKQTQFLKKAFDTYTDIEEETTATEDLLVGFSMVAEAASDFITVGRNLKSYSAYLLGDNPAFYRDGQYLLDFETMNQRTAAFAIFGFQPREMTELYEASNTIKREQGSGAGKRPFFEQEAKIMLRLINTNIMGARTDREAQIASMMVSSMFRNRPTKEGMELFDKMNELAEKKKLDQDNLYYKYLLEIADGIDYGYGVINSEMSRRHEMRKQ